MKHPAHESGAPLPPHHTKPILNSQRRASEQTTNSTGSFSISSLSERAEHVLAIASSAESLSIRTLVDYLEELLGRRGPGILTEEEVQLICLQVAQHFGLRKGKSLIHITV